jgi:hypothetical protein
MKRRVRRYRNSTTRATADWTSAAKKMQQDVEQFKNEQKNF